MARRQTARPRLTPTNLREAGGGGTGVVITLQRGFVSGVSCLLGEVFLMSYEGPE